MTARAIIDPFNGGARQGPRELRELLRAVLGAEAALHPAHTASVSNRDILLRLQTNIKLRLIRDRRQDEALAVMESMLMFAPDRAELWREAGLLHASLGNLRAATLALKHVLALPATTRDRHEAATLIQRIEKQIN